MNGETVGTYTAPNDNPPMSTESLASEDHSSAKGTGNSSYRFVNSKVHYGLIYIFAVFLCHQTGGNINFLQKW